jgi:hypothetical protein
MPPKQKAHQAVTMAYISINNGITMLRVFMLISFTLNFHYVECHFVECHYAECLAPFKYKGPLAHPFCKFDTRVTLVGGWLVLRLHRLRSITTKTGQLINDRVLNHARISFSKIDAFEGLPSFGRKHSCRVTFGRQSIKETRQLSDGGSQLRRKKCQSAKC